MSQHDYIISNQGFPATRADINNVLNSIATLNSGTSAPATQYAGQMWIDTTTATSWILYIYDGADNIQLATINTSTNTVNFTDSALDVLNDTTPQLGGNLDVNGNSIVSTSNANITLAPDGTGDVVLSADTVKIGDANANATITTDGTGDLILNTNSGSSSGSITIADGANADITIAPNGTGDILLDADRIRVGDSNADATITSNGTGDLILNTNSGTNSGSITIADGANGNITVANNGTGQIVVNAGAVGTPVIAPTGDLNTGIFFPSADTIAFTEGGTEAMRIDSSGNVGIGTSSPTNKLEISSTGDALFKASRGTNDFSVSLNSNVGGIVYVGSSVASPLALMTTNTERMRIESGGDILIGKTASGLGTAGVQISSLGSLTLTRSGSEGININRTTNDGNLIRFFQDGTEEGNISVSGTTVSYNGFTGSHWSRFIGDSKPDVLRGTVMESLDQMIDWYHLEFETSYTEKDKDGNDVVKTTTEKKPYALKANEQEGDIITYNFEGTDYQATIVKEKDVKHVMSKISDTNEAKNVYGVFSAWDNDDLINNDFYVASVGSYVVRIKAGETVNKGDLLQSNGDGTAKVQADDIVRASSFAKVLSNSKIQTYEDGSFIVPCSLMC